MIQLVRSAFGKAQLCHSVLFSHTSKPMLSLFPDPGFGCERLLYTSEEAKMFMSCDTVVLVRSVLLATCSC